jgi:hypothetical protein
MLSTASGTCYTLLVDSLIPTESYLANLTAVTKTTRSTK